MLVIKLIMDNSNQNKVKKENDFSLKSIIKNIIIAFIIEIIVFVILFFETLQNNPILVIIVVVVSIIFAIPIGFMQILVGRLRIAMASR